MRNLSKVLALVLAMVLVFGMISAGAANFTDSEDITATEAVDMLTTLGVIEGYPDGTFGPNGTVTRAEMAKMIFTIRNGGNSDASAYAGMSTPFKDAANHWAKGYINYCYTMGIVNGKSATSFDPDAPVTGLEAAKMALVCLGYNAEKAGLTGIGWDQKAAALGTDAGLFSDYGAALAAGAPRQFAAQLLYNALFADTVRLVDGVYDVRASATAAKYGTLGNKFMNLDTWEGILKGTGNNGATNKDGFNVDVVKQNGENLAAPIVNKYFEFKDVNLSSLKNQYVKVTTGKSEKVYGVYAVADKNNVVRTTADKITDYVAATSVKIDGVKYDLEAAFAYAPASPDGADTVVFIDNNGNKKFETATVIKTSVGKVSFVGTETVTVNKISGTFDLTAANQNFKDIVSYEGIAKDDYVIAQRNAYLAKDSFTKATVVSGTISGTKTENSVDKYLIDGAWYKFAPSYATKPTLKAGDSIDYVAIGNVIYYAKKTSGASGTKDLAILVKAEDKAASGTTGASVEGVLAFADGTSKTVTINKHTAAGTAVTTKTDIDEYLGQVVSYKYDNDGKAQIELVSATNLAGYDATATRTVSALGKDNTIGGKEVADDAVIFVFTGAHGTGAGTTVANNFKVITGKEFKRINNATHGIIQADFTGAGVTGVSLVSRENGFEYVKVASVLANPAIYNAGTKEFNLGLTSAGNYGYLIADSYYSYEGGKDYNNFPIWDGSATVTVKEQTSTSKAYKAGDVIAFDPVADNVVKNVVNVTKQVAVTGYADNKVQIGGVSGTYKVTADTVIFYIDSKNKAGVAGGSISLAGQPYATGVYLKNAIIDANNAGGTDLAFIAVDVNNELKDAGSYVSSIAALNAALANGNVTINDNLNVDAAITVPAGRTLTLNGVVTMTNGIVGTDNTSVLKFGPAATVTAYTNLYKADKSAATAPADIQGKTFVWDADADGSGTAGWLAQ